MTTSMRLTMSLLPITLILITSGCTSASTGLADLDQAPAVDHPLPAELPSYATEDLDQESIRWVGEHDDADLWVASHRDEDTSCVIAYPDADNWIVGCGGGVTRASGPDGITYSIVPDGMSAPDGFIAVSENVFVAPQS